MPARSDIPRTPPLRKRRSETNVEESSKTCNGTAAEETIKYTEEQLLAVEQIRKCKDYYEILGVTKDANESDLRRQYKKLALQFHPDKNKAPGAVEAFKAIGNAFAVLSDPVKRKRYDMYGLEAMQTTENPQREGYFAYAHAFEGDITPEELYNMFFHGNSNMFFQGQTFVRRDGRWQRYQTRPPYEDGRSTLMQILPLVFIILVSVLSSFFVSDPPYSLQRTTKYLYEQKTSNLDVPYYVRENFLEDYKGRIPHIERQVEEEYIVTIRTSCFRERNYKENMIWRAKHFKDISLEIKARELRTPSCDILNDLYKSLK
ncbi:dnaJ homolog subfamily B member 1-like isoform X2 [Stegodyphus dumicola]|uniref:dnaJ homolog subfamily B member 1-like isoform X2 n=1 Tax=Stegodyphus dumicola TaxID=202533 RepID=UPI0015B2B5B0|nr:dnaJ homolog subfamily B member 1-like isoform X2 [Stegodyphus dumicola]